MLTLLLTYVTDPPSPSHLYILYTNLILILNKLHASSVHHPCYHDPRYTCISGLHNIAYQNDKTLGEQPFLQLPNISFLYKQTPTVQSSRFQSKLFHFWVQYLYQELLNSISFIFCTSGPNKWMNVLIRTKNALWEIISENKLSFSETGFQSLTQSVNQDQH